MRKKEPKPILYQKYLQESAELSGEKEALEHRVNEGFPKETVIIYEHGGFYEFMRKLGFVLLFIMVLLLITFAIVAVMTTIFEERGYIDGFIF